MHQTNKGSSLKKFSHKFPQLTVFVAPESGEKDILLVTLVAKIFTSYTNHGFDY